MTARWSRSSLRGRRKHSTWYTQLLTAVPAPLIGICVFPVLAAAGQLPEFWPLAVHQNDVGEPLQLTISVVGTLSDMALPAVELIEQLCPPPPPPHVTINALPVPLVVKLEQLLALIVMLAPRAGAALNAKKALANAAPATNDVAFETTVLNMLYSQKGAGWAIVTLGPSANFAPSCRLGEHFARDYTRGSCQAAMTLYLRRSARSGRLDRCAASRSSSLTSCVRIRLKKKAEPKFRLFVLPSDHVTG